MAIVHFIEKPNGKKVARIGKFLRAIYDDKSLIIKKYNLISGKGFAVEGSFDSFLEDSPYDDYTFDEPSDLFLIKKSPNGFYSGVRGDVSILIDRDKNLKVCDFACKHTINMKDIEASILQTLCGAIWQNTGSDFQQNNKNYRRAKNEVVKLFKKGHVKWVT